MSTCRSSDLFINISKLPPLSSVSRIFDQFFNNSLHLVLTGSQFLESFFVFYERVPPFILFQGLIRFVTMKFYVELGGRYLKILSVVEQEIWSCGRLLIET